MGVRTSFGFIRGHAGRIATVRRTGLSLGLAALLIGAGAGYGVSNSQLTSGPAASTIFINEPFTSDAVSGNWTTPTDPTYFTNADNTENDACLTAEGTVAGASPIPQCSPTSEPSGSGALQLTNNGAFQLGTVFTPGSIPTTDGLVVHFTTYQFDYNNSGGAADGIGFVLAAANPIDPVAPTVGGNPGGALGYGPFPSDDQPGIPNGYLGVGLDVYGNYLNPEYAGTGCTALSGYSANDTYPEAITVRGPGDVDAGYCPITTTGEIGNNALDEPSDTTRPATGVPVLVVINPLSNSVTETGLNGDTITVASDSYYVEADTYDGMEDETSALPTYTVLTDSGTLCQADNTSVCLPASWVNTATGLPYQLSAGWTASTGGGNEYHQINNLTATSVTAAPALGLSITNTATNSTIGEGGSANFTFTPSATLANGATEQDAPTLTATFPTGLTPNFADLEDTNWDCSASTGQTLSCTYSGTTPITTSGDLSPIKIPVSVTSAAPLGLQSVTGQVVSTDATPVQASSAVTVDAAAPAISLVETEAQASPTVITGVGQVIQYDFVATNTGNTTIDNLAVSDTESSSHPVSCPVTLLDAGASVTCTGTYVVTKADIANGRVSNSATATASVPATGTTVSSNATTLTVPITSQTIPPSPVRLVTDPPSPVRLVTGPPNPLASRTDALPLGLAIAGIGASGLGYAALKRKQRRTNRAH